MFLSNKSSASAGLAAVLVSGAVFAAGPTPEAMCAVPNAPANTSYMSINAIVGTPYREESVGNVNCEAASRNNGTCIELDGKHIQGFATKGDKAGVSFSGGAGKGQSGGLMMSYQLCKNGAPIPTPEDKFILCTNGSPADYGAHTSMPEETYVGPVKTWEFTYQGVIPFNKEDDAKKSNWETGCARLLSNDNPPAEVDFYK